jgi:mono/diheme cytochrome c family protein
MLGRAPLVCSLVVLAACKGAPTPPADEEAALFHNVCARCHGQDGTGGPPDPLGNPGPKNFTDPAFQRSMTDAQLRNAIENGNRGMPAFGAVLTDAQIKLMIGHIRKLDPTRGVAPGPSASPAASAR